jgi:hypothetical protein
MAKRQRQQQAQAHHGDGPPPLLRRRRPPEAAVLATVKNEPSAAAEGAAILDARCARRPLSSGDGGSAGMAWDTPNRNPIGADDTLRLRQRRHKQSVQEG